MAEGVRLDSALWKKLVEEGLFRPIIQGKAKPDLMEFFRNLDGTYFLLEIEDQDGGQWLYRVEVVNGGVNIREQPPQEAQSEAFLSKNFTLVVPGWVVYDVILGEMNIQEAADHAVWGGSLMAHPVWVYLNITNLLEEFEELLDRNALLRLVRRSGRGKPQEGG